jgi:hypothetical protein
MAQATVDNGATLFRAIPRGESVCGVPIGPVPGRRLPSHVPYVVDNLWEYARPDHLPSRRHSVYASPTPELALANASAGNLGRDGYVACRIELACQPRILQLSVDDARKHADIPRLVSCVNRYLPQGWAASDLEHKLALAPLFMPGITRDELAHAMTRDALLRAVVTEAAQGVTIWDTQAHPPVANGELFFEIRTGEAYILHPLE